jgi:hypothetical protein
LISAENSALQNSENIGKRNLRAVLEGPICISNLLSSGVALLEKNLRKRETAVGKNFEFMYNASAWSDTHLLSGKHTGTKKYK